MNEAACPFPDIVAPLLARLPRLRGRLLANQPMAPLTWFRVGGPAQALFTPADEDDLAYFLAELPVGVAVTVVGVGSNLIVRDGGIPGIVIRLSPKGFGQVEAVGEGQLQAGAAALDRKVADAALASALSGLEFLAGIPGSIGGALRMNAGANGRETRDVVRFAHGVTRDGDFVTLSNEELGFSYRQSAAPADIIFTGCVLQGQPNEPEVIRARMAKVHEHREQAQPIREKTGGSTFKNPPGHSAWKLVDAAGLRGQRLGGAMVSELHCNFLINTGEATAADIEALGELIRARVLEHSGVQLEWEIKRLGVPA
jgi:UDP-N-acetylmuramate dehydrogenase